MYTNRMNILSYFHFSMLDELFSGWHSHHTYKHNNIKKIFSCFENVPTGYSFTKHVMCILAWKLYIQLYLCSIKVESLCHRIPYSRCRSNHYFFVILVAVSSLLFVTVLVWEYPLMCI